MTIPQTWFAYIRKKHAFNSKLQMRVFYSLFIKCINITAIRTIFMARENPSMYIKFSNQSISTTPFLQKISVHSLVVLISNILSLYCKDNSLINIDTLSSDAID